MAKTERLSPSGHIVALFMLTYTVSYITRINFGAVISSIEKATGFQRSLLSASITGSFITYGAGQIVSGRMGDRFSPKKLISGGLFVTSCMNALIPLSTDPYQMAVIWCVNGFAQSFMWPPLIRLLVLLTDKDEYSLSCTKVSFGSSLGTILVYLISPVIITFLSWKYVFWFSALVGFTVLFIWNRFCVELPPSHAALQTETEKSAGTDGRALLFTPFMIGIMMAIILQGMLRDGITTWTPTYVAEVYGVSGSMSIMFGVILPVFGILCLALSARMNLKLIRNPLVCGGIWFGLGTVSTVMLYVFSGSNVAVTLIFLALCTGSMHGVNLMLVCMIPKYFGKTGKVSLISGVLNFYTYVGSAVSAYGIAMLSQNCGWSFTILLWIAISAVGTAICAACAKPFAKGV